MKKKAIAVNEQTKVCPVCGKELPLESYNKGNGMYGRQSRCRECEHKIQNSPERMARRRELELLKRQNPEYVKHRNLMDKIRRSRNLESLKLCLLRSAKQRASNRGMEFTLTSSDIILPKVCPLLGIELFPSEGKASGNSYTIDRIDSTKGYTPDNVWVISKRANTLKNDATIEELELLVHNLKSKLKEMRNRDTE